MGEVGENDGRAGGKCRDGLRGGNMVENGYEGTEMRREGTGGGRAICRPGLREGKEEIIGMVLAEDMLTKMDMIGWT